MSDFNPERDPLEQLAEEWRERLRRGERFDADEYTVRHPELAEGIRDLFDAIVLMEDLKPAGGDLTGAFTGENGPASGPPRLERLGDYRILREVGRGGMGVVYEAEQESLGRRVALKVLPSQALADHHQHKRFQREARATARLHHTNIVPVYGVGEHEGMCYYVMQFIQGAGLDQVLTELKRLRKAKSTASGRGSTPQPPTVMETAGVNAADVARSLITGGFQPADGWKKKGSGSDPRSSSDPPVSAPSAADGSGTMAVRLPGQAQHTTLTDSGKHYYLSVARMALQVAEALEYANSQGIIHRDIKPSNLLLDNQGTVWVTDFGLAKALADGENLTHTGDIVGTLRYMAPERFIGHADARGDIYSLGLTLYELLVQQPAFAETDRNRLIHQVTHQEPSPPRKLNPDIPRDLETIVLKAIDREPARRYSTAAALAEDLTRFIEDRPIGARRVSARERLWRWCRRNPALAGLAASVVLLGLIITIGASVAAVHFRDAYEAAEQARAGEARQLKEAQDARRLADAASANEAQERARAVDAKTQAEANFGEARRAVDELLTRVSEGRLKKMPGMQALRKELLDSALKYYQGFVRKHGADPALQKDLANAYARVAVILAEIGSKRAALTTYDKAGEIRAALLRRDPKSTQLHLELAAHHQAVGNLRWRLRDHEAALKSVQKAYDTLLEVAPQNSSLTTTLSVLGGVTLINIPIHTAGDPAILKAFAGVLNDKGAILQAHDPIEALKNYSQAVYIYKKLLGEPALHAKEKLDERGILEHELARQWSRMGNLIADMDMFVNAGLYQQEAQSILQRLLIQTPRHPRLDEFRRDLAAVMEAQGDLAAARPGAALERATVSKSYYRQALAIREQQFRENPAAADAQSELANCLFKLALADKSEPALAMTALKKSIDQQRALLAGFPDEQPYARILVRQLLELARLQKQTGGNRVDILDSYRQARALLETKVLPLESAATNAAFAALPLLPASVSGLFARFELDTLARDYVDLACTRAAAGDDRLAIVALNKALVAGWKKSDLLLSAPELAGIRDRADFKIIVKRMKDSNPGLAWVTDVDKAKARAAREGKDLFLYFTGRDWIPPAVVFQKTTLGQEAVMAYLSKHFVPVELDRPMFSPPASRKNYQQAKQLIDRWKITNFGMMVLTDAQGRAYWMSDRGSSEASNWSSTEAFLKAVEEQRQRRLERDRRFAAAEKAGDDLEKAKLLDAALGDINSYASQDYLDIKRRIFDLDRDNRLGLRAKYFAEGLPGRREHIRSLLQQRDWQNALRELSALLEAGSLSGSAAQEAYRDRGYACLGLGQFDRAAADLARGQALQCGNPEFGLLYAYALVQLGDVQGYQQACADLLKTYRNTAVPWNAFLVGWACGMAPDTVTNWSEPIGMLKRHKLDFLRSNALALLQYRAGNDAEARRAALQSLKQGPSWLARNELILALVERRRGKPKEAREWLDKFLTSCRPDDFRQLHATGYRDALVYQELLGEAALLFEGLPSAVFSGVRKREYQTLIHLNRWSDARAKLDVLIAAAPDSPLLYLERGRCFEKLKEPDKVAADFSKAFAIQLKSMEQARARFDKSSKKRADLHELDDARRALAVIQQRVGRPVDAALTLVQRTDLWTKDAENLVEVVRDVLAVIPQITDEAEKQRLAERCVKILRQALELGSLDLAGVKRDGRFQALAGRVDFQELWRQIAGRDHFVPGPGKALPLAEASPATAMLIEARRLTAAGKWEEAESLYDAAFAKQPGEMTVRLERARFRARRGQWRQAIADYDALLQSQVQADLWSERGCCHAMLQDWDQAAADFVRALDLMADISHFTSPKGLLCRDIAGWPPVFERVTRLRPGESLLWIGQARYHVLHSDWDKARVAFARVIDSRPLGHEWLECAAVQALAGDLGGYRTTCRKMIDMLATKTDDPGWIYFVSRACALDARSPATATQFELWAERAASGAPANPWSKHVRGLALFRAGQYAYALERIRSSSATTWSYGYSLNALAQALLYHHLGEPGEACASFDTAAQYLEKVAPVLPGQPADLPEPDWLEAVLLQREAGSLFNVPARRRAGECLQNQEWQQAISSFDELIKKDPAVWPDRLGRARTYIRLQQWPPAAADYARLVELQPGNAEFWFERACLLRQLGDDAAYRKLCADMHDRFGRNTAITDLVFLAHTCVLGKGALGDTGKVLAVAKERMARTVPPSDHAAWSAHVLALAQYRAGSAPAAVELLAEAVSGLEGSQELRVLNWLVLAMAQKKCGQADRARASFKRAESRIAQQTRGFPHGQIAPAGWHWRNWLMAQVLKREAEQVLAAK